MSMTSEDEVRGPATLHMSLLRVVNRGSHPRQSGILAAWSTRDLRRFKAWFDQDGGGILTTLPTNTAEATTEPVAITLLTMIDSPDGQPIAWAVVFQQGKGVWFKLPAPRYSDDHGLSVAQDTLEIYSKLRQSDDFRSELVIQEADISVVIKEWLGAAYQTYLRIAFVS